MWTRQGLKKIGKATFKINYMASVIAALLLSISGIGNASINFAREYTQIPAVVVSSVSMGSLLLTIFVFNPLKVGSARYFINNSKGEGNLENVLFAFRSNYFNIVKTMFLVDLSIFLWTLAFIIPGVIRSYSYRLVPYLLAENPDLTSLEVKEMSATLMVGQKMDSFVLDLSFILWHMASLFTAGLLEIFYVKPYQEATNVELYNVLKRLS